MKLTPAQRQKRLYDLMAQNPEYQKMQAACDPAKRRFDAWTAKLPPFLRDRLREYPGRMFFMHNRIIETVCKEMQFPDEV